MKKILVSLVAFSCIILSATAQDKPANGQGKMNGHDHQDERGMIIKELNLTPDQQEKLKASREDFKTQMASLNDNESITVKDYRDRKYILRKEQKMQFLNILTPDQKAKLEQLRKDGQAKRELI